MVNVHEKSDDQAPMELLHGAAGRFGNLPRAIFKSEV